MVPCPRSPSPCCFWGFRKAPSFLTAWATFIGFIVVSRVVINWSVGEPWGLEVLSGLGLIAYGLFLTIQGENDARKILFGCAALALVAIAESRRLQFALPLDFEAKPWMLYLFVGALIIAVQENIYRRGQFERYFSWKTLRFVVPLDFVCCGALFYGYRDAEPSFLFGWAVYTFFDVILRVWNNYVLKEPFKATHMLGMLLVIDGAFLTYVGGGR